MPTNNEKHEIAQELRDPDLFFDSEDSLETIAETVGIDLVNYWHWGRILADRLADLIEPEPERTCEVVTTDICEDNTHVSELTCGHKVLWQYELHYCTCCGAKVVKW